MQHEGYWLDCMGESIDGMEGIVTEDYTDLPGNDSHYAVDLGLDTDIGVHWMFLAYPD